MEKNLPVVANYDLMPISIEKLKHNQKVIHQAMKEIMVKEVHYGTIPGTDKPTLYKAGAEIIANLFRLVPAFETNTIQLSTGHREITVVTTLTCGGVVVGQGVGSCSTMEKKYRWRNAAKKCPACGKETIIKGKKDYGGGWLCFQKKGGCNAKFNDGDQSIEGQSVGQIENPDIADEYNTVLKLGKKRSLVDAVICATGASDVFNQDLEDFDREDSEADPRPGTYEEIERRSAKKVEPTGPVDWASFKYRYHLPVKKQGWQMDSVREGIKAKGFRFNEEDKHWYGNAEFPQLEEYLRPLNPDPQMTDADLNGHTEMPNV